MFKIPHYLTEPYELRNVSLNKFKSCASGLYTNLRLKGNNLNSIQFKVLIFL